MNRAKKSFEELEKFFKTASEETVGDLLLSRMNLASNAEREFQDQVQTLLHQILRLVEFAEDWAQREAEQRYVNYVREAARQRRRELSDTIEVKGLIDKE